MKTTELLIIILCIPGCSSIPVQAPQRTAPESLLIECPAQAVARDGRLSTILRTSIERSEQYHECKSRHKALSDWARNEWMDKSKPADQHK